MAADAIASSANARGHARVQVERQRSHGQRHAEQRGRQACLPGAVAQRGRGPGGIQLLQEAQLQFVQRLLVLRGAEGFLRQFLALAAVQLAQAIPGVGAGHIDGC